MQIAARSRLYTLSPPPTLQKGGFQWKPRPIFNYNKDSRSPCVTAFSVSRTISPAPQHQTTPEHREVFPSVYILNPLPLLNQHCCNILSVGRATHMFTYGVVGPFDKEAKDTLCLESSLAKSLCWHSPSWCRLAPQARDGLESQSLP